MLLGDPSHFEKPKLEQKQTLDYAKAICSRNLGGKIYAPQRKAKNIKAAVRAAVLALGLSGLATTTAIVHSSDQAETTENVTNETAINNGELPIIYPAPGLEMISTVEDEQ